VRANAAASAMPTRRRGANGLHLLLPSGAPSSYAGLRSFVNWNRVMFRYSDPAKREKLANLKAKTSEIQELLRSPDTASGGAAGIDWDAWQSAIRTPGVVDMFRRKYEKNLEKEFRVDTSDDAKRQQEFETEMQQAEKLAAEADANVEALNEELAVQQWELDNTVIDDMPYMLARNPRAFEEAKSMAHSENMTFAIEKETMGLTGLDFKELRKQLNEGNVRAMAVFAGLPDTGVLNLGPYKNMKVPTREEQMKNPSASIIWIAAQIEKEERQAAGQRA